MKTLLIFSFSLLIAATSLAQQTKKSTAKKTTAKKSTASKSTAVKYSDNTFILKALNDDLMEIELGGYAEKNAGDQRVKDFGAVMVRDHRRTKTTLKSIASNKNMTAPETMDASHKARVDALQKKQGDDFDKHYIDLMVTEHTKGLAEYRRAQSAARDKELKELLARAIALMQTHLNDAKSLQASIKGK